MPSQVTALAILVPQQRGYATEPSTSNSSSQSYPPPGFNAEQAKKPLPQNTNLPSKETTQTDIAKTADASQDKAQSREVATKATTAEQKKAAEGKKETKNLTIGQKIKKEVQHYWDGTKLLSTEVKISLRLALKMAAGYELSRREHRQVRSEYQVHDDVKS